MILEIIEWVLLIAALVVMVLQFRSTSLAQYRGYNTAFWVLMAGCFAINGVESGTGWEWVWYIAAVASLAAAFVVPKGLNGRPE